MYSEDHGSLITYAMSQYGKRIFDFWYFIDTAPMLGLSHPVGKRILKEIRSCPKMTLNEGIWYRATEKKEHLCTLKPSLLVTDARYNSGGQVSLYLANSDRCAVAENTTRRKPRAAFVQRVKLKAVAGVLDIRPGLDEDALVTCDEISNYAPTYGNFLTAVIFSGLLTQIDEHYFPKEALEEAKHFPSYVLPRFFADCARLSGFTGLVYRSTRLGGANLVLFKVPSLEYEGDPYQLALSQEDIELSPGYSDTWWYDEKH